ncbi:MAG: DeoR/GlpR family DNA-binding transcription regulator [Anaerolineae bacterium]|nr:DeoR/GlpR family DNA-binding transcription regulator [Anaerolineae bacterium]
MDKTTRHALLVEQRRQEIVDLLQAKGSVNTEDLCEYFKVSQMTIWRDLKVLEDREMIKRVHGGALLAGQMDEPVYTRKQSVNRAAKERIARYACQHYVHDNQIIIMEAGTTVMAMCRYLTQRNLTVITNGLGTLNELSQRVPQVQVLSCGGMLRDVGLTFVGPQAEQFFHNVRAHTLFLSATGITLADGICDPNLLEIQIKQSMAASVQQIVLLLDRFKFGVHSLKNILPMHKIDVLITDETLPDDYRAWLEREGVTLKIAP